MNTNLPIDSISIDADIAKRALYQEANEKHNVDLVSQLNESGMKPKIPCFSGPTIISSYMDIATKHGIILHFLKELRETNRLLNEREFQSLSSKKWIKKDIVLSRILGCDHLIQKIMEGDLQHIKVPLKIAVVEEVESLKVSGHDYRDGLYDIYSTQIKIYAETVPSVDRKLSRDEIDELIHVITTSNFTDLLPENIIVAEDGIYFIDTEFKSFAGKIRWKKMERFKSLIDTHDKEYFAEKIKSKVNEPDIKKEINGYNNLEGLLEFFESSSQATKDQSINLINEIKKIISDLDYVGAKKAGSDWLHPNKFSFNLRTILTQEGFDTKPEII